MSAHYPDKKLIDAQLEAEALSERSHNERRAAFIRKLTYARSPQEKAEIIRMAGSGTGFSPAELDVMEGPP